MADRRNMLETFLILMLTGASLQLTGAGKPDEESRKLKYRGPVVYSNLPPPVLYFPSFPPDPKISSRGDSEEKGIEYVPFPYENLPLLVYQSDNQPPVHVVEKSRDSTQVTQQPKDNNAKIQQQSGPAAPEMSDYVKNNQQQYQNAQQQQYQNAQPQQYQNAQPQAQKSSSAYSAAPQPFPDIENQQYLSIGISTYNAEGQNNVLYGAPQPAVSSSPPLKQNVVSSYQVQNNVRPNSQQQSSYTIAQNNVQKGQQQQSLITYDHPQPNQYISNDAVQHQGQRLPYGQSQANFQIIPHQKPPVQNQYAQIPEQPAIQNQYAQTPRRPAAQNQYAQTPGRPATQNQYAQTPGRPAAQNQYAQTPERPAIQNQYAQTPERPATQNQYAQTPEQPAELGYSVQQNYGPKQMPASIQQLIQQQTNGDKANSYQYSGAPVSSNTQSNSNYNIQQQGAGQDHPQYQKLQVQVQASTENVPDDDPDQQFLSIALYPYDIRGNNYKDEEKQFYKIVIPPLEGQNVQENSYGAQRVNPMEIQGQSIQYMKIGGTGPLEKPGSKQMNYPSNPSSLEMQKQQVMALQKLQAMIIQQPAELQRQHAMNIQKQKEVDMQKQRETEIQKQRGVQRQKHREVQIQKQREVEMQKQKAMNMRRQHAMEMQKRKVMEMQRQQAMEKEKQEVSQNQGQNLKSSTARYQTEAISDKANQQKQNTKQESAETSPEAEDDAIEYQQILIHIPHALAAQPQIVVQKGNIEEAVNPYTGTAQVASIQNDTDKLLNAVVTHIRHRPSYSGPNKQQIITLQNSDSFRDTVNSNFFKQPEFIKLPSANPAVTELIRQHYGYERPRPKSSFRSRHPGVYASSNYHFTTTNPIFLNAPSFPKNTFRSTPSYSFAEPPTLLQSSSHQYHNLFSSYPDELLAEASYQSPTYIPLVKPGQNAMSVLNAPQFQTSLPGSIRINARPPHPPYGAMPHQMIYGNRNFPPPPSVSAGSGKYGGFIKKLTTLSNIILSQSLGMKSQITPREEAKYVDEYNVEEVDDSSLRDGNVQEVTKESPSGDLDITSDSKQKLSKRISNPEEDIPRPPIIVYKGTKPPVEVYGTKDDIEKGKSPLKKATMKQTSAKVDRNEEVDLVKTMYSILPKFVKRSITNRNDDDESDFVESEVDAGNPPDEGEIIDELEALVDSDDETVKKEVASEIKDSAQSANSNNEPTSAVNEDIENLMKLLHKEEKSDIFPS